LALVWRFSITVVSASSISLATVLVPLTTIRHRPLPPDSLATALPPSAGPSGVRSCADPSPLATAIHRPPDWQRPKGARSRRSVSLYISMSQNRAIPSDKLNFFSSHAAAQPLTIPSWLGALNASDTRHACRMAISRNSCSLLDFPEFAQAVRYGVPGTTGVGSRTRKPLARAGATAPAAILDTTSSVPGRNQRPVVRPTCRHYM
jgi:hypothetical protein